MSSLDPVHLQEISSFLSNHYPAYPLNQIGLALTKMNLSLISKHSENQTLKEKVSHSNTFQDKLLGNQDLRQLSKDGCKKQLSLQDEFGEEEESVGMGSKNEFKKMCSRDKETQRKNSINPNPPGLIEPRNRWSMRTSQEAKLAKYEEQKFVAKIFCENGADYYKALTLYPQMTPKAFRCHIEAINNQNVNEVIKYLRYECNVKIEKLNRDQKRSMRTQLTKIREWLGNRDLQQLEVYYRFIRRQYDRTIEVQFEPALKLYKTLIQIIRSPYVNVHQAELYAQAAAVPPKDDFSDERALIIEYLKSKDLAKVSDLLCQSYGYHIKWSTHSIKQIIIKIIRKTMTILQEWIHQHNRKGYSHLFTQSNISFVSQINNEDIKDKLLAYYLQKSNDFTKISEILIKLNYIFAIRNANYDGIELPKLEQTCDSAQQLKKEDQNLEKIQEPSSYQNHFYQQSIKLQDQSQQTKV